MEYNSQLPVHILLLLTDFTYNIIHKNNPVILALIGIIFPILLFIRFIVPSCCWGPQRAHEMAWLL